MFRITFRKTQEPALFIADTADLHPASLKVFYGSGSNVVFNFSESCSEKARVKGGWLFRFKSAPGKDRVILVKVSTSTVSHENAQNNIDQETGDLGFNDIRAKAAKRWQEALSVVDIDDPDKEHRIIFYTALYHSLLLPWVIDDVDRRYKGADKSIHKTSGANQYDGFSPWDTFRSLNPLLALLYRDKEQDIVSSMLDQYTQKGHLWPGPMTGNHEVPILLDAYAKGLNKFDKEVIFHAMKSAVEPPFLQSDMQDYQKAGYVASTHAESVTRTVEYAYDDWAVSQLAGEMGRPAEDLFKETSKRSGSYFNLLDLDDLFFLPRSKNAFNREPGMTGYKEGDKWVYSYFVPHDPKALINLLGGKEEFAVRLDFAFEKQLILFDNETVFQLPYLFNTAGKPSLTQKWTRQIIAERYHNSPGGLPGNDDLGSVSSWYVFSSLGIYPFCAGRPYYTLTSPFFKKARLHFSNGKTLTITSNSNQKNKFIGAVKRNGIPLESLTLRHADLIKGGSLNFLMKDSAGSWPLNKDPQELSETKGNPSFQLLSCSLSKPLVFPDEAFKVYFTWLNKGETGVKTVQLSDGKYIYGSRNCLIRQGETISDSLTIRLYRFGKTKISVAGLKDLTIEVKPSNAMADTLYSIENLKEEPMVSPGEVQQLSFLVRNLNGLPAVFRIPCRKNDSVFFLETQLIAPGEARWISTRILCSRSGFTSIQIGKKTLAYKVYAKGLESALLDLTDIEDKKNGILNDRSGYNNDARIIHIAEKNSVETTSSNQTSNALYFNENTFVEVPNSASLDSLHETLTMMAWVCPTGSERGMVDLFTKGDLNVLQVKGGKTLSFFAGGWGRGDCTVDLPADWKNHWHHIAGVCEGKTLLLYIDGSLRGKASVDAVANLSSHNKWTLGRNEEFPSERIYHGRLAKAKVFSAALKLADIESIIKSEQNSF